jgi:hypothetical protein
MSESDLSDFASMSHLKSGWSDSEPDPCPTQDSYDNSDQQSEFKKSRKSHYNMKNILLQARELVNNEETLEDYSDPNKYLGDENGIATTENSESSGDELDVSSRMDKIL